MIPYEVIELHLIQKGGCKHYFGLLHQIQYNKEAVNSLLCGFKYKIKVIICHGTLDNALALLQLGNISI